MIKKFRNKTFIPITVMALMIHACGSGNDEADAYGNFEAHDIIISAQVQGVLQSLELSEGVIVNAGTVLGRIDSSTAWLKKEQLLAQRSVILSRLNNIDAQLQVQAEQKLNIEKEVARLEKLLEENAATGQQYDDITGKKRVIDSQTEAIRSQKEIVKSELAVSEAQLNEADNMLEKCRISSPISGTILEKYVVAGELVSPGKSLFKIANLNEMELRVYISGSQLSDVAIGDSVSVRIDGPEGSLQYIPGVVSWIASQVEFTPKIIQTKEERVSMVYAVKIRVQNDGRIKIGMPGEAVWLTSN
jgi:HlyD family secretion protein